MKTESKSGIRVHSQWTLIRAAIVLIINYKLDFNTHTHTFIYKRKRQLKGCWTTNSELGIDNEKSVNTFRYTWLQWLDYIYIHTDTVSWFVLFTSFGEHQFRMRENFLYTMSKCFHSRTKWVGFYSMVWNFSCSYQIQTEKCLCKIRHFFSAINVNVEFRISIWMGSFLNPNKKFIYFHCSHLQVQIMVLIYIFI